MWIGCAIGSPAAARDARLLAHGVRTDSDVALHGGSLVHGLLCRGELDVLALPGELHQAVSLSYFNYIWCLFSYFLFVLSLFVVFFLSHHKSEDCSTSERRTITLYGQLEGILPSSNRK